jgi:hypothetical protein
MALGDKRRHYRAEALEAAAELIRQHGTTSAMDHLPEDDQVIFDDECRKLAVQLEKKAQKYRDV